MSYPDVSGTWRFYGQPEMQGKTGKGQIELTLRQSGTDITGRLVQKIDPWSGEPPADPEATRASVIGRLYVSEAPYATLIELVRVNEHDGFKAIFSGIIAPDAQEIRGHVVNNRGAGGSFFMHKMAP